MGGGGGWSNGRITAVTHTFASSQLSQPPIFAFIQHTQYSYDIFIYLIIVTTDGSVIFQSCIPERIRTELL